MKKIALLVDVSFMTRVVVEVPENFKGSTEFTDDIMNDIADKAAQQIAERIRNNETLENITGIDDDNECPYGTLNGEE